MFEQTGEITPTLDFQTPPPPVNIFRCRECSGMLQRRGRCVCSAVIGAHFSIICRIKTFWSQCCGLFFSPLSDIQTSGFCSKLETSPYKKDLFTSYGSWIAKISRQKSHSFVKKTTFLIGSRVALKVKRENIHISWQLP